MPLLVTSASATPITTARAPRAADLSPQAIERRWDAIDQPQARAELLDERSAQTAGQYARNIEGFIGTVKVPVGVAGPLRVHGSSAGTRDYFAPLATTEATLVASYNRGARLISAAGGCSAIVTSASVARAPGFVFTSIGEASRFVAWTRGCTAELQRVAADTSRFARLVSVRPIIEGNHVYLILDFTSGDAAGQNMVTVAAQAIVEHVVAHSPVRPRSAYVEANLSGDKKASAQSMLLGRGRSVTAEVVIPPVVLIEHLRATPAMMTQYFRISAIGAVLSGAIGMQGHYANGLTALFLACGQDVACVAESAVGITRFEEQQDGSLYACVTLPSLVVGTVGGGTALPSQRACLEVLQLGATNSANEFAELCAAVVLAGELSIVGAIVANEFTQAHVSLGRRSPSDATTGRALS